ncbi:beta-N-acetylhexosaminidase [Streptantibioticus silvisoli]|uniref:beta-N-acetylhexosaminidase n=1 Tax=Streptantibioticus silvisoli TaxID=2705255 RepID=A0ABT6W5E5_9ACTN|nr:beta-N-acetylhexosaminidase [Streptantibioticus silvisoli]MDI5965983.1 beta-N-acetylhexosaminidase [Streptantibioticus silvisoli]
MDLIPAPRHVTPHPAAEPFVLTAGATLDAGPGTGGTARWLRGVLGAAFGTELAPGADGAAVRLRIDAELGAEAYRLEVTAQAVTLTGGDAAGVFWGAQTLRQLCGPAAFRRAALGGPAPSIAAVLVEDRPRFRWRGFMLDVARHFLPKDVVLRYVDLMAAHKLNVLHLHLTDDQGWRVEIKRYPRLTQTGAWRERTKVGLRESPLWDERPHGGFYTGDDIREIVAYAAARHITVVPEIDVPGHSQAAIAAYPELGNADVVDTAALGVLTSWGVNVNVLAPTEGVLRFYEDVLTEVLDLFPSKVIHLGGDECPKEQWMKSDAAQDRIRELGLRDEEALQSWFIGHFGRWLADRGRQLAGWDEILQGGSLVPGALVASWRGYGGGIKAAEAGHDVVMCPEQQVYLDHRQHAGPDEPVPIGFVRTLEDVHRFEPVPPRLAGTPAQERVIGAQANIWTEVLDSVRAVDYAVFPRLSAFAEVVWSDLPAPERRDHEDFTARMSTHYQRLDALGVEYRPPGGPHPWQRRPGVAGRPIAGPPPIV